MLNWRKYYLLVVWDRSQPSSPTFSSSSFFVVTCSTLIGMVKYNKHCWISHLNFLKLLLHAIPGDFDKLISGFDKDKVLFMWVFSNKMKGKKRKSQKNSKIKFFATFSDYFWPVEVRSGRISPPAMGDCRPSAPQVETRNKNKVEDENNLKIWILCCESKKHQAQLSSSTAQ